MKAGTHRESTTPNGLLIRSDCHNNAMRRYSLFIVLIIVIAVIGAASAFGQTTVPKDLSEFQKETVASIREITLQLLLLAVGVVALIGGFAADKDKSFGHRWLAWLSFIAFGMSVIAGLLTYGNLIYMLAHDKFDPLGQITTLATTQWSTFGAGGVIFTLFILLNLRRRQ